MKRVEVRCCCTPRKLLGTLPVGDAELSVGATIMFGRVPLKLKRWSERVGEVVEIDGPSLFEFATREIAGGVAFKADGLPIEILRTIPEFIEAKGDAA